MKKIFLLFLFVLSIATVKAQLPDGAQAPDWTLVDLDGNTHHLQVSGAGNSYIDMFATWCGHAGITIATCLKNLMNIRAYGYLIQVWYWNRS